MIQLWIDKTVQKVWRHLCSCGCGGRRCCKGFCRFFCLLFYHTVKAALIGLLWVVSLFIDGDFYVCCFNEKHPQLACKAKNNITPEEQESLATLKNQSRIIGFSLLLFIICSAVFMSSWGKRCCKKTKNKRRAVYDKLILKEEKNVLKEILTKAAKDSLTKEINERIQRQDWETCFEAAAKLIDDNTAPIITEKGVNEESIRLMEIQDRSPEGSGKAEAVPSRRVGEVPPGQEEQPVHDDNSDTNF
ncbi:hypothetical protein Q5P01_007185 [Channa striata]|uniref:Uncharacterized protein n=1 Tax=Channa striata TaxID=64152 RepID=A0AA88N7N9_CHASR|nr:hypothetical protein Q5P01_007185 [Channa striata]